ncbi:MAG: 2-phospho-L-lactate guanylyltransferase [Pseudomonadales bacterium]|nr:2-phospho-L-lactate guanylyltransferase [Halieaceae bacterium]MCP5189771.1 2-phospho-L-lactate guanylyltransferase [Pseudomonadales bacterium]MCP5205060.1 2-phospho-L-lactate guanylyltransferase [Pseudomonadales bacterium]
MARALVPLKDLVQAKTRLAGLLCPSERRALTQAMLEDVLQVLTTHPEIKQVILLSDDPSAPLLARQWGLLHWPESKAGGSGLNAVAARASELLLGDAEGPLLVLHADLPLLGADDISAVLAEQARTGGLVIGCDRHGDGTNLLAFGRPGMPRFQFGPGSCGKHLDAARQAGIAVEVLRRSGLALDVDEPQDLAQLLAAFAAGAGRRTRELLVDTAVGRRLDLALATLASASGEELAGAQG